MKQILICSPTKKSARRAFTLVELMVTTLIFGIMTQLVYNALYTSIKANHIVNYSFNIPRKALMLSKLFEREFTGIYLPEIIPVPRAKKGTKQKKLSKYKMKFGLIGKEREVHFTTLINLDETADPAVGDILEIGYEFDSGDKTLTKRVDPYIDDKLDKGGDEVEFKMSLESLKFEYYDKKWESSWDSSKKKKLPRAIRISFELVEVNERDQYTEEEIQAMAFKHQVMVLLPNAVDNKKS
ncbi:prepilin-type N-terminal cleavage/methylation domain-containing protein [bacterium]|nr:prepilin-type N-terminal cleavage/methylation domain-containing protein [bacterium]